MTTVAGMTPGDRVSIPGGEGAATFVQRAPHPLYPHLCLVVWRMPDGSWSHDALAAAQDVGEVLPATPDGRRQALRQALLHRSQW